MKRRKILFTAIMCLAMVLSLTLSGCSDKKEAEKKREPQFKMAVSKVKTIEGEDPLSESAENGSEIKSVVKDNYFKDAVFIGDSRTQGLMMFSTLKSAKFYADKGMSTVGAFNKPVIPKNGMVMTIADAMKLGEYNKIYISLGINELGYPDPGKFIERYGELIDIIKKGNPKAKIFVQGILPVSTSKSASDPIINNVKIADYNNRLLEMSNKKKAIFLNVGEGVSDETGALAADGSWDGVHLNKEYCLKWEKYIMEHIV